MKLETFFEKFDLFANAPYTVAKLRRFILDLAVQGKLVPQDAKDEPANKLLIRIQEEKARLVKAGQIKRQEQLPPISDEAIPFALPAGWAATQLGDVTVCLDYMREPINGTEREARIAGKPQTELYPYFGATQQQGWIDDFIFDEELVLLGEDGVPFFDDVRAKAYLVSGRSWVNNHAHVFRGIIVSNVFLMHWLNTFDYTGRVAGSTRSKLNQAKAVDIPIALPPIAEQKRIVAKVNELMALCDRLEAQQQEREKRHTALARASLTRFAAAPTPANLNVIFHPSYTVSPADLRKAILTLAVNGQLLGATHARLAKKTRFGKVVDLLGGYAFKSEWFTDSSGVRLVRNQNISHGALDWSDTEYLPKARVQEFEKWALRPGDLVLSLNRPFISTGLKLAWIRESDCPCLLVQRIVCLRPDPEQLIAEYLYLWCNAPHFYRDAHIVPSSGVPYIAPPRVAKMEMSLPSIDDQRRIVAKVEQLMALVDALETQLTAGRATASKLLAALVAELTGTKSTGQVAKPAASVRRGRPRKA